MYNEEEDTTMDCERLNRGSVKSHLGFWRESVDGVEAPRFRGQIWKGYNLTCGLVIVRSTFLTLLASRLVKLALSLGFATSEVPSEVH